MILKRTTYPSLSWVMRATSSSVIPAVWALSVKSSVVADSHRGGNTTHHQFWPAPSPSLTRKDR